MISGTPLAREVKCCVATRVFNVIPDGEGTTPTFATHEISHVCLLFNEIQRHISDLADGSRRVCAYRRRVYGTRTSSIISVSKGGALCR